MSQTIRGGQKGLQNKIQRLVIISLLAAMVAALQMMSYGLSIAFPNSFNLALTLIPIVLGAVLYGPRAGTLLGGVFGIVVAVAVVTGLDKASAVLFQFRPFLTVFLCVLKGVLAGFAAGAICNFFKKKSLTLGVFSAAIVCPIVNTATLSGGLLIFYNGIMQAGAETQGYESALVYVFLVVIGINFLIELAVNVVLGPAIIRVIQALKKSGILKLDTGNV